MKAVLVGQSPEMAEMLKTWNVTTHSAVHGIDGIRKSLSYDPGLLLVEVDMPHLDGINMMKILNLLGIETPVLFTGPAKKYEARVSKFPSYLGYLEHPNAAFEFGEDFVVQAESLRKAKQKDDHSIPCPFGSKEMANLMSMPGRRRILMVEDDPFFQRLLETYLDRPEEYELYFASNGAEGLRKAVLINPDLILSDISMPKIDGLTMGQILYILGKPYPIVYLTAHEEDKFLEKARGLSGVIGYIKKGGVENWRNVAEAVAQHLEMAETLRQTSEANYLAGSLGPLAESDGNAGVMALK